MYVLQTGGGGEGGGRRGEGEGDGTKTKQVPEFQMNIFQTYSLTRHAETKS